MGCLKCCSSGDTVQTFCFNFLKPITEEQSKLDYFLTNGFAKGTVLLGREFSDSLGCCLYSQLLLLERVYGMILCPSFLSDLRLCFGGDLSSFSLAIKSLAFHFPCVFCLLKGHLLGLKPT